MSEDTVSCRIIRSCMDYASTRNIDLDSVILRHDYSPELLEDSYNWVSVDFLNEMISKIEKESGKNNVAFEIGGDSTSKNSWGDIENVIKAMANPKPILLNVERFTAYFLKVPVIKLMEQDANSVTIKAVDNSGHYHNAAEFIMGALITLPRLWGGEDLSAIRYKDRDVRINFTQEPCFFDTENDYKKYSPKLLEEIIVGLEKTKKTIEHKNKELEKKNKEIEKAYKDLETSFNDKIQNEKMATLGELSAGIAHEINNPLSFIVSNFQSLKKYLDTLSKCAQNRTTPPSDITDDIPSLIAETEDGLLRVKKLVEDINYMAHPGQGEKTEVDVKDLIRNAVHVTRNVHKNELTIQEHYDHTSRIYCTPSKISQVFMNIILNSVQAIKANDKNNEHGKIIFRTNETEKTVEIEITDNGAGIKEEDIPHLTEPFFTTKKAGEGTGLGLSTANSIINTHHGQMVFESTYGKGTTVKITLPNAASQIKDIGLF
ncbi:MAG: ATP-binding protein [Pseudomonadota bacterium]